MDGTGAAQGLFSRALSGGALTAGAFALTQGLRLLSNLVLTRLLFPEAFGMMALVTMVLVGLQMFSDAGIGQAISRSPRGDEPDFLNTAWTVNVVRGAILWALAILIALPLSWAYRLPDLALLLPVAGISLLVSGFNPTRIDTANRHLLLGRVTLLDLAAQALGVLGMILLAWATGSVWALVLGAILTALARLALMHVFLPGPPNRFHWEAPAVRELVHFGKWIFLSTACGFAMAQGDKAILGIHLTMAELGIYNIGFFLASFPMMMVNAAVARIMLPLYRDHSPASSGENRQRMRRLRFGITLTGLVLLFVMGVSGESLVALLYDQRWQAAAPVVVAIVMVQMPMAIGLTYDQSALAAGDGRGYFFTLLTRAVLQTGGFLIGAVWADLGGALIGQAIGLVLAHFAIIRLARRHDAWDGWHDLAMGLLAAGMALALWRLHPVDLASLLH